VQTRDGPFLLTSMEPVAGSELGRTGLTCVCWSGRCDGSSLLLGDAIHDQTDHFIDVFFAQAALPNQEAHVESPIECVERQV